MSYTDLRDFVAEYTYVTPDHYFTVQVEKSGGGTVGKAYTGMWRYIVTITETGKEIARAQDFYSGTCMTHRGAAITILEIVEELGW